MSTFPDPIKRVEQQDRLILRARLWAREVRKELVEAAPRLTAIQKAKIYQRLKEEKAYQPLNKSIRYSIKKFKGDLDAVRFIFLLRGIFLEVGAGRGRKAGTAEARQYMRPWIRPVLEDHVVEFSEILAKEYADIVTETLTIILPGALYEIKKQ